MPFGHDAPSTNPSSDLDSPFSQLCVHNMHSEPIRQLRAQITCNNVDGFRAKAAAGLAC